VVRAKVEAIPDADRWRVTIEGACTFLSLPRLTRVLAEVPRGSTVTLHIAVSYLDHAAHQSITDWQQQHQSTGGTVHIDGLLERGHPPRTAVVSLVGREAPEAAA